MKKSKIFPLDDYWKAKFDECKDIPGVTNAVLDQLKNYIAFLNTAEALCKRIDIKKPKYLDIDIMEMISFFYFAHCYHLACSTLELLKLGYCNGAAILVRGLIESLIDLAYLWLCKKINHSYEEREAWIRFSGVRKQQINNMWKEMQNHREQKGFSLVTPENFVSESRTQELEDKKQEFKKLYGRDTWSKLSSLRDRARAVDDLMTLEKCTNIVLEQVYILCYRWTSGLIHGESVASNNYLIDERPKFLTIYFGRDIKDIVTITAIAQQCLLNIMYIVNHINHLSVDIIAQLESSGFKLNP
jgi:hypothetical protein